MSAGTYEVFGRCVDRAESHIERLFVIALLFSGKFTFRPVANRANCEIAENDDGLVLGQQVPIAAYRLDFAFKRRGAIRRVAVECDGRMFHTSPEQVERDKVRDRNLLALGWSVVRFSAKELIGDPIGCAGEAIALAMKLSVPLVPAPLARTNPAGQLLLGTRVAG